MGRVCIYLTALAAISANLLVPEQLVSYRPCCYDENGNFACAEKPSHTPVIRGTCCDPIVHDLRNAPPPMTSSGKQLAFAPEFDALPVPAVIVFETDDLTPVASIALDTGPPIVSDVLPLHCRFNI